MPSEPPPPPSELTRTVPSSAPGSARILWLLVALVPILVMIAAALGADEY